MQQTTLQPKYLRQRQLLEHLPVSPATLWRMVGRGDFPKPIKLAPRVTCWLWSDVEKYLQSRQVGERHE